MNIIVVAIWIRFADLLTTYFALTRFDSVDSQTFHIGEANPISRWGIQYLGWWSFAMLNLIVSVALLLFIYKHNKIAYWLFVWFNLVVVFINAYLAWGKLV